MNASFPLNEDSGTRTLDVTTVGFHLKEQADQAQWLRLVIPATREAEAGDSLEPGGGGCSELRLHSILQPGK